MVLSFLETAPIGIRRGIANGIKKNIYAINYPKRRGKGVGHEVLNNISLSRRAVSMSGHSFMCNL